MSGLTLLRNLIRCISELSTQKKKGRRFYPPVFMLYVSRLASQAGNISHTPPWSLWCPWIPWGRSSLSIRGATGQEATGKWYSPRWGPCYICGKLDLVLTTQGGERGRAERMSPKKCLVDYNTSLLAVLSHTSECNKDGFPLLAVPTLLLYPLLGKMLRTLQRSIGAESAKPLLSLFPWLSTCHDVRARGHSSRQGAFSLRVYTCMIIVCLGNFAFIFMRENGF